MSAAKIYMFLHLPIIQITVKNTPIAFIQIFTHTNHR